MCYLASGVFWITDTEVGLLMLVVDFAGDVAMSFLDRSKASVEKCKIGQLLNYHHDIQCFYMLMNVLK